MSFHIEEKNVAHNKLSDINWLWILLLIICSAIVAKYYKKLVIK